MNATADQNLVAIGCFLLVIAGTLGITYWAARRTRTHAEFYTAGAGISGFRNGLAISGDFMSAATFLGITGLTFAAGFDAIVYQISPLVGFSILLFLVAEPLRNLGRFTVTNVATYRLHQPSLKIFSATASLVVVTLYLVVQMVGAGALMQVLFNIPYDLSVTVVGALMITYVAFGGMTATTWVQITKATILLVAISILSLLILAQFDFNFARLYREVAEHHPLGAAVLQPGTMLPDPISTFSLALALTFGISGLPHVLMRLFTTPNAHESRRSVIWSNVIIGYVFIVIFFIVGYVAVPILAGHPERFDAAGDVIGGTNMVVMHIAEIIGGQAFFGFIAAVAFATILAVVSGLTIAGASAISHDLYAETFRQGKAKPDEELRVSRIATFAIGLVAVLLGMAFEKQNISYLVSMVLAVSASASFPLLILALYWRGLTALGGVVGGSLGLVSAILLLILGPTIWVEILGNADPIFPYRYPAVFSVALGFGGMIIVSLLDRRGKTAEDDRRFADQQARALLGPAAVGESTGPPPSH